MMAWGTWLSFNDNQAGGFWLLWSILNLLMNRKHPPPLNDVTRLETRRIALGLVMLVVFILTFMPEPLRQITF
jgi:membrane-associated protease RseP (regulator of RpoE activity)